MKINEKLMIDTNILIYSLNEDSDFYLFSRTVIKDNPSNIYIAYKSITEFVAVLSKLNRYDIIKQEIDKILSSFHVLFPDSNSLSIFQELVLQYNPKGNRVYDYEIASVMLAHNIKRIATINKDDYKKIDQIQILFPS